ncbi:LysR family transcriptional regulator [Aeromicrobium marinum]|uniref:LysR family transcriptional regulator n=1 Tax=Aeromicrobium marinum TaxID=219314 RepID=UPI0002F3BE09|nr:LysR family transcriptional regulator [Aeromicrobium marinum]
MNRDELYRLDLNLLLAFDALMAESSVTRAAERMSIGQPAMSASLARLRKFFDDPLLVRQGRSLAPTNRALELVAPIREALDGLESTIRAGREFDPTTSSRTFTVMASDYVLLMFLGPLLSDLRREAPHVRFEIFPVTRDAAPSVVRSQLDLLIYPDELVEDEPLVRSRMLFTDRLVCAVARDHPDVGDVMTEHQFRTLPSVSFSSSSTATISDMRLQQVGYERPLAIEAQSFVVQPLLLPGTTMMALLPERLARYFESRISLRLMEPPVELSPLREAAFWSARADADPAHRWLRRRMVEAAARMESIHQSE